MKALALAQVSNDLDTTKSRGAANVEAMIAHMAASEHVSVGALYSAFGNGCSMLEFRVKFLQEARDRLRGNERIVFMPRRGRPGMLFRADWAQASGRGDRQYRAGLRKARRAVETTAVAADTAPADKRAMLARKVEKRESVIASEVHAERVKQRDALPVVANNPQGTPRK